MGLDITAYADLKFVGKDRDEERDDTECYLYTQYLPERADGMAEGVYEHDYSKTFSFRAGSYSGYSWWRDELSKFAFNVPAKTVWENTEYQGKPFYELIHFSDCEGFIGPKTSAKLAKDFDDYAVTACQHLKDTEDYQGWQARYDDWRKAFKIASDRGAVKFH